MQKKALEFSSEEKCDHRHYQGVHHSTERCHFRTDSFTSRVELKEKQVKRIVYYPTWYSVWHPISLSSTSILITDI